MRVPEPIAAAARMVAAPYLVSRAVLSAAALVANRLLPYGPPQVLDRGTPLQGFLGWDSVHYLGIARHGYPAVAVSPTGNNGYFPLLPVLLRLVGASDLAALVLGLVLGFVGLATVVGLTAAVTDTTTARQTAWAACLWPAAFYWSAPYTEALFAALAAGSLWSAWRGRGLWAAGLGLLAALTRPTGLALALPLLFLLPGGRRRFLALTPLAAPLLFGGYLAWHTSRAGALLSAFFGHGHLSPGRPWDAFVTAATWARYGDWQQLAEVPVLIVVVALVVLLGRSPRWRRPALATAAALLLPPLLAGTISSFARYAMVAFPIYWPLRRFALPAILAVEVPVAIVWTAFSATGHLTP